MFRLSCVVIFFVFCSKGYGQVIGGCSQKFHMHCIWIRFFGDDCSHYNLRGKLPFYETNTTNIPAQPGSFEADGSYRPYSDGQWYPGVNLTLTTPHNTGKNYLKGFEVVRYDASNTLKCYILDLSNIRWDETSISEMKTIFWLDLFPLNPNPNPLYKFELNTLPKHANKENRFGNQLVLDVDFQGYGSSNSESATDWKASTILSRNYNGRTINVTIETPPDKYGFTLFRYDLVDNTSNQIIHTENSSQLWYEFTDVAFGVYKIRITPINDGSRCPCNFDLVCSSCSTTITHGFTFNYKSESSERDSSTMSPVLETTTESDSFKSGIFTESGVLETTTENSAKTNSTCHDEDSLKEDITTDDEMDIKINRVDASNGELYQQEVQILQLKTELLKQRLQQEKELFSLQIEMLKSMRYQDRKIFKLKKRFLSRNTRTDLDQI